MSIPGAASVDSFGTIHSWCRGPSSPPSRTLSSAAGLRAAAARLLNPHQHICQPRSPWQLATDWATTFGLSFALLTEARRLPSAGVLSCSGHRCVARTSLPATSTAAPTTRRAIASLSDHKPLGGSRRRPDDGVHDSWSSGRASWPQPVTDERLSRRSPPSKLRIPHDDEFQCDRCQPDQLDPVDGVERKPRPVTR
jgi:hypothetical protein